uniref:Uncharacterized protein PF11_0207-like n=1 Tax=Saccoglossus kowalevskii TaxID=10224 RepID=A0ABM0M9H5_SACKO|nr:PREDICTED: uncharacterized protein PF11_0207-like [Saccoglossus kowalevskii]
MINGETSTSPKQPPKIQAIDNQQLVELIEDNHHQQISMFSNMDTKITDTFNQLLHKLASATATKYNIPVDVKILQKEIKHKDEEIQEIKMQLREKQDTIEKMQVKINNTIIENNSMTIETDQMKEIIKSKDSEINRLKKEMDKQTKSSYTNENNFQKMGKKICEVVVEQIDKVGETVKNNEKLVTVVDETNQPSHQSTEQKDTSYTSKKTTKEPLMLQYVRKQRQPRKIPNGVQHLIMSDSQSSSIHNRYLAKNQMVLTYSGATIDTIRQAILENEFPTTIKTLTLNIAGNDRTSSDDIWKNYEDLIFIIKQKIPNIVLFLCEIFPRRHWLENNKRHMDMLIDKIKTKDSKKDIHRVSKNNIQLRNLRNDGIHINHNEGVKLFINNIKSAINYFSPLEARPQTRRNMQNNTWGFQTNLTRHTNYNKNASNQPTDTYASVLKSTISRKQRNEYQQQRHDNKENDTQITQDADDTKHLNVTILASLKNLEKQLAQLRSRGSGTQ